MNVQEHEKSIVHIRLSFSFKKSGVEGGTNFAYIFIRGNQTIGH